MCANNAIARSLVLVTVCAHVFAAISLSTTPAHCQTIINVPPAPAPSSIGSNTTVNLLDGGMITVLAAQTFAVGNYDGSSTNAVLNIVGGQFLSQANAATLWVSGGGSLNIHGGEVIGTIDAGGGNITIDGGFINRSVFGTQRLNVRDGSTVSISAGILQTLVSAESGGELLISGGSVALLASRINGDVQISGGTIGRIELGENGSSILVKGGDYRLNGVPISGLSSIGSTQQFDIPTGATLTGVLEDGSPFAFIDSIDTRIDPGVLTLETVSLPPIGPLVITASTDTIPHGIRNGQTLIVDNGAIVPNRFTALTGSTVNVEAGGVLGHDFEAFETVVNMSGGIAGGNEGGGFTLIHSELNLSGGRIFDPTAVQGSKVTISGGEVGIGGRLQIDSGSEAIVTGGVIGGMQIGEDCHALIAGGDFSMGPVDVLSGGTADIAGGIFSPLGRFDRGLDVEAGGAVNLFGSQFKLDGVEIQGLVPGQPLSISQRNATLTGVFADGSPFSFPLHAVRPRGGALVSPNATLTLTLVPEPTTLVGLCSTYVYVIVFCRIPHKHSALMRSNSHRCRGKCLHS